MLECERHTNVIRQSDIVPDPSEQQKPRTSRFGALCIYMRTASFSRTPSHHIQSFTLTGLERSEVP